MSNIISEEKTNFTMKLDKSTRDEFIGISMSAAINALIKQTIRQQGMSFSLRDENGLLPEEAAELSRRRKEVDAGNYERHDLIEV